MQTQFLWYFSEKIFPTDKNSLAGDQSSCI
jgi:hypothetical protein